MGRSSLMYNHPQVWPAPVPQPLGEAAAYDSQFYSENRQPMHPDSHPGPVPHPAHMQYAAYAGPADAACYEQPGVHPQPPAGHPQPPASHSPFMAGPGFVNPHPVYSEWSPERAGHVAVGGLTRSHLMPGSYVQSNKAPAYIVCPHCRQTILTKVKTKTGARTVVAAAAIFAVYWPLAFIPFVAKPLKKKVHVCTRCGHKIGKVVTVTPA